MVNSSLSFLDTRTPLTPFSPLLASTFVFFLAHYFAITFVIEFAFFCLQFNDHNALLFRFMASEYDYFSTILVTELKVGFKNLSVKNKFWLIHTVTTTLTSSRHMYQRLFKTFDC